MEDLSKYTKIELQKMGNDIQAKHEALKKEIIAETYEIEKLEISVNSKAEELQELEKNYVEIVEKLVE
jgi:SMC interacting uncharacterized protein involved in chromosome segregation